MILAGLLTDPVLQPWESCVYPVLGTAVEADFEAFLLFAFSRNQDAEAHILAVLSSMTPQTWAGIAGVLNALLWLSVKGYVEQNSDAIYDAYIRFNRAWWITVQVDLTKVWQGELLSWVERLANTGLVTDELLESKREIEERFTNVESVFGGVKYWLRQLPSTIQPPSSDFEWLNFATVCFWLGYLKVGDAFDFVSKELLQTATVSLDLEILSEVTFALSYSASFEVWFSSVRPELLGRFRSETTTVLVEDDGETMRSHFVIDIAMLVSGFENVTSVYDLLKAPDEKFPIERSTPENIVHSEAMQRVRLLRKLIPDRDTYGCRGYGHMWASMEPIHDESIKEISTDYLLPDKATHVNKLYSNLGEYKYRPDTWKEYALKQWDLRQSVISVFKMLQKAVEEHFRKKNLVNLNTYVDFEVWEKCLDQLRNETLIPKPAVDEWGFTSESKVEKKTKRVASEHTVIERLIVPAALSSLKPFLEHQKKLSRGVQNFLPQALRVFKVNTIRARETALSPEEREQIISGSELRSDLGSTSLMNLNDTYFALPTYQTEFRARFGQFFSESELTKLEKQETETYKNLWCLWHLLVNHANRRIQEPLQDAKARAERIGPRLLRAIEKALKKLSKRGINAGLLEITARWEEQTSLWITVDSEPLEIYEDIQTVLDAIQRAVGEVKYGSLEQVILEQLCEQVCILPLVGGKLISPAARRISSHGLFVGNSFEGQDWWNRMFHPLSPDLLRRVNLEVWQDMHLDAARQLVGLILNLYLLVAHLSDFKRFDNEELAEEIDERAREIVQPFFKKKMELVGSILQAILDKITELLQFYDSLDVPDPILDEAMKVLAELHANVLPQENQGEDGNYEIMVELATMPEWLAKLEQATIQTELLYLAWLEHVRDHP